MARPPLLRNDRGGCRGRADAPLAPAAVGVQDRLRRVISAERWHRRRPEDGGRTVISAERWHRRRPEDGGRTVISAERWHRRRPDDGGKYRWLATSMRR